MSDYEAIQETVFHYCEGYRQKNRERLETWENVPFVKKFCDPMPIYSAIT